MSEPSAHSAARLSITPSPFNLGITYQGAELEGSFQVNTTDEASFSFCTTTGDRDVFEVIPKPLRGQGRTVWKFRVNTNAPGEFFTFMKVVTPSGSVSTHFAIEIREGAAHGGRVFFWDTPFSADSDSDTHKNLRLMVRELQVQFNAAAKLPADLAPFRAVVLHGLGLRHLVQGWLEPCRAYLAAGGRVVILANYFYRNSVTWGNHLTEPYGISLEDREYPEHFCESAEITPHTVTEGVRRLHWFRPSPMTVHASARLLVRSPAEPGEGFLACGGPRENLFVLGNSLLHSFLCEGWPFDNARLLANLLGYQA